MSRVLLGIENLADPKPFTSFIRGVVLAKNTTLKYMMQLLPPIASRTSSSFSASSSCAHERRRREHSFLRAVVRFCSQSSPSLSSSSSFFRTSSSSSISSSTLRRKRTRRSERTKISAGLFGQSKEEKIVEQYLNSKEGHEAILKAKREGKSKKELLKMHKRDIVRLYTQTKDMKLPFHIISQSQRLVFASFLNAVIDIPILNEATEQIIFMKAVDVIADAIERQLEKMGSKAFFEGVTDAGESRVDMWVVATATKINEKIDIPVLNEKQEQEAIEFVLHAMAERFLASQGKTIAEKKGKGKMFGFI